MAERDEGGWTKTLLLSASTSVLLGGAAVHVVQFGSGRIDFVLC